MNLSLTVALFILLFVGASHAAPLTSSSPWQGAEHGSLSVASNKISHINEPETVQRDGTTFLVDPTMSTPSLSTFNITTPNDKTTTGITAGAPPRALSRAPSQPTYSIVTMVDGPLSCAAHTQYIDTALTSMNVLLGSARGVLHVSGVEKSIGVRALFGPRTLLTYMHRLNVGFRPALSSVNAEELEGLRTLRYRGPQVFYESAKKLRLIDSYYLERYGPGKAIVIGCPSVRSRTLWEQCTVESTAVKAAYTNMKLKSSGDIEYTEIFLCPPFFQQRFMVLRTVPAFGIAFKRVFLTIMRTLAGIPGGQQLEFRGKDPGA